MEMNTIVGYSEMQGGWCVYEHVAGAAYEAVGGPFPTQEQALTAMRDEYTRGVKCLVFGCSNHTHQGKFVGDLCAPCHLYLTTGKIGCTDSFLGDLVAEIARLKAIHCAAASLLAEAPGSGHTPTP